MAHDSLIIAHYLLIVIHVTHYNIPTFYSYFFILILETFAPFVGHLVMHHFFQTYGIDRDQYVYKCIYMYKEFGRNCSILSDGLMVTRIAQSDPDWVFGMCKNTNS
eukprot:903864_1